MVESNSTEIGSVESINTSNLNNQQFRLNKINEIENYFIKKNKIVMLARSKLNSIESEISEALMNNQISHDDFMPVINEEKNYRELKEIVRIMKVQEEKKIDIG